MINENTKTLGFLLIQILIFQVNSQESLPPKFTRSCNDPLVQNHLSKYNHTYCSHACGLVNGKSRTTLLAFRDFEDKPTPSARCDASGKCICSFPCPITFSRAPRPKQETIVKLLLHDIPPLSSSSSICPPRLTDPLDTLSASSSSDCSVQCSFACPGGLGQICGEVKPLGTEGDIFALICTCTCPTEFKQCLLQKFMSSLFNPLNVSRTLGLKIMKIWTILLFTILEVSAVGLPITLAALIIITSYFCDTVVTNLLITLQAISVNDVGQL